MTAVVLSLLHSLRFVARSRALLHLEIIALRYQLAVVNRSRRPAPFNTSRLVALGVALWVMARLVLGGTHREAGNGHCVARLLVTHNYRNFSSIIRSDPYPTNRA